MKHIKLLLILILTTASSFAFSQWAEYNTQPQKIEKFSFVDDNIGYTISATNTTGSGPNMIYKTSDGGNSWTTIQLPLLPGSGNITSIDFTADGTGVISVYGAITGTFINYNNVYSTIDDGATWNDITPLGPTGNSLYGIVPHFVNTDIGFVTDNYYGLLYRTIDGGVSWDTTNLSGVPLGSVQGNSHFSIATMDFFDENNGIISLEANFLFMPTIQLLTTIDGGVTWENVNNLGQNPWFPSHKIIQVSPSTAYASSSSTNSTNQIIFKITNNGLSVDTISLPIWNNDQEIETFDFFDELNGFIVLKNHNTNVIYIKSTNDGGANWITSETIFQQIFGATININDLHLTNTSGYLSLTNYTSAGPGPMWLESFYKFEGDVGISEIETTSLSLYPNPAAAGQTIRLNSDRSINQASIFDLNGALISKRSIHNNSMELPSLNPGMYIILLSDDETTESTRLIIK